MEVPQEVTYSICIKNMVCPRCIRVIEDQFALLNLPVAAVQLGQVDMERPLLPEEEDQVRLVLEDFGFELLKDKKAKLVEQIKTLVIDLVHYKQEKDGAKLSTFLAQQIGKDYSTLSHTFSSVENMTIERFLILQKVEFTKAQLEYGELSLKEIASVLHYSSLSHFSKQFKDVTGLTPSEYRKMNVRSRRPLDQLQ